MAAHLAACSVTRRTECRLLAFRRANEDVRSRPHRPANQHRLTGRPESLRQSRSSWTKGAGRALAVDKQLLLRAVYTMFFKLARVVRHVVEDLQPGFRQDLSEGFPRQMCDDLAVCQRTVDAGPHCSEIFL